MNLDPNPYSLSLPTHPEGHPKEPTPTPRTLYRYASQRNRTLLYLPEHKRKSSLGWGADKKSAPKPKCPTTQRSLEPDKCRPHQAAPKNAQPARLKLTKKYSIT